MVSVYVGNLSYETSWQTLKDHMKEAGEVNESLYNEFMEKLLTLKLKASGFDI